MEPTPSRAQKWAGGLASIDTVHFALAQELAQEESAGTWRDYTFSMDYPVESKQGKHPNSFGSFLEGHSFDMRALGFDTSRGELAELLEIYKWAVQMGATVQHLAGVGLAMMRRIYRLYRDKPLPEGAQVVTGALQAKARGESYFLPSYEPEGKVKFAVETEDAGDGTYILRALIVAKDGVTYRNRWPKALLHYLTKRLRASNITRETA